MRTTSPPRREWTRLETPDVVFLAVALLVVDLAVGVAVVVIGGDARCKTFTCHVEGVSITRPLIGLGLAVGVTAIPLLWAWWRRRGLRTTAVIQLLVGAVLVTHAVTAVSAANAARRDPVPVPFQPSLRPCVAKTLEGFTCLSYPPTPPPSARPEERDRPMTAPRAARTRNTFAQQGILLVCPRTSASSRPPQRTR